MPSTRYSTSCCWRSMIEPASWSSRSAASAFCACSSACASAVSARRATSFLVSIMIPFYRLPLIGPEVGQEVVLLEPMQHLVAVVGLTLLRGQGLEVGVDGGVDRRIEGVRRWQAVAPHLLLGGHLEGATVVDVVRLRDEVVLELLVLDVQAHPPGQHLAAEHVVDPRAHLRPLGRVRARVTAEHAGDGVGPRLELLQVAEHVVHALTRTARVHADLL